MNSSTSTPSRSAMSPLVWTVLALSAVWCIVWFHHALGYWEDDSFIHLEFARSVAEGRGFQFNGRTVYGDTSPLWVLLLVGIHKLIPGWMAAGKTLTALAACFSLSGVFLFARSLVRERLAPAAASLFAALMVLVLVTNPYFGYWAFSGMEALTGAGLVCWGALAVGPRQLSQKRFYAGALCAGLAPILRPEMIFFTVLLGLVLLQRLTNMRLTPLRKAIALADGLIFALLPALLWASYALRTFGMVVPNTNAAKRAGPLESVPMRLVNIYTGGFPIIALGVLLLAAWVIWYYTRGKRAHAPSLTALLPAGGWLLLVWTAINCVFYIVDHTYVQTRYIFVTAPVLTIALLAIAAQRWPRIYRVLLSFGLTYGVLVSLIATWPLVRNKTANVVTTEHLAAYVSTLPPDAGVASYSIGEMAFYSRHTIIDTGGITRPGAIPYMFRTERPLLSWASHEGARYIISDHLPVPGSVRVWAQPTPIIYWSLKPKSYHKMGLLQLWTLPAQP